MEIANQFFIIFLVTIILVHLILFLKPIPGPIIKGFRIHHYMYGIIAIPISLIFSSIPLYAVGMGLFIDELTYLLIGGKTHQDNYSKKSLLGTMIFILAVFLLKEYLIIPLI